jgi:hypothetical protein
MIIHVKTVKSVFSDILTPAAPRKTGQKWWFGNVPRGEK